MCDASTCPPFPPPQVIWLRKELSTYPPDCLVLFVDVSHLSRLGLAACPCPEPLVRDLTVTLPFLSFPQVDVIFQEGWEAILQKYEAVLDSPKVLMSGECKFS